MSDSILFANSNAEETAYIHEMQQTYHHMDLRATIMEEARAMLASGAAAAIAAGALPDAPLPDFVVELPADAKNGDLASNIAMAGARAFGMAPRKIAEAIAAHLPHAEFISRVDIAGPGFINLYFSDVFFASLVMCAVVSGREYGRTDTGAGQKVNVEFVSANPTGPMHLGNARGGALGDVLAATLEWAGYDVTREFYINDAGNQVVKFGKSLAARFLQLVNGEDSIEFPEDGYQGEDIKERAQEYLTLHGPGLAQKSHEEIENALVEYALPKNIQSLRDDLAKYRIEYDVWFHESALHEENAVQKAVDQLAARGATYEKDGAIWYKATEHGGDKDEVLIRANGIPTYFAADIAYHANKFNRGFTKAIDVWGADHHGHVARMKGALDAIGLDGSRLDIVLMQFVRLVRDGEPVRMSKRTGKAITLTDLLDEVPLDSARFFFNLREPGSQIEFDLGLAVAQDSENPVYYVQYANARICSILKAMAGEGVSFAPTIAFGSLSKLNTDAERGLIRQVAAFPGEIVSAAKSYDPARITRYLIDLAAGFHKFYNACHIKGEEASLQQARLALCIASQTTLQNGLSMLKVSAPESM